MLKKLLKHLFIKKRHEREPIDLKIVGKSVSKDKDKNTDIFRIIGEYDNHIIELDCDKHVFNIVRNGNILVVYKHREYKNDVLEKEYVSIYY